MKIILNLTEIVFLPRIGARKNIAFCRVKINLYQIFTDVLRKKIIFMCAVREVVKQNSIYVLRPTLVLFVHAIKASNR